MKRSGMEKVKRHIKFKNLNNLLLYFMMKTSNFID